MSLASIIYAVFGINIQPTSHDLSQGMHHDLTKQYGEWRDAIHSSRGEATKAISAAIRSHKESDQALTVLNETIKRQEETKISVERDFLNRARGRG